MRASIIALLMLAAIGQVAAAPDNSRCGEFAQMLRDKATEAETARKSARTLALNLEAYEPALDFAGPELAALQSVIEVAGPASLGIEEYANRLDIAVTVFEACAAKAP